MSQPRVDACFANEAGMQPIMLMTQHMPDGITGTPSFHVNGKDIPLSDFSGVDPTTLGDLIKKNA